MNPNTYLWDILALIPWAKEDQGDGLTFDLDAHKEEVRFTPDTEFESIQLVDDLIRSMNIGYGISLEVILMTS